MNRSLSEIIYKVQDGLTQAKRKTRKMAAPENYNISFKAPKSKKRSNYNPKG